MDGMTLLRLEHKRIASLATELAAIVNQPMPPEPLKFLAFRREFRMALAVHLAQEDWVIYPKLRADTRPEVRALATRFAAEALAFSDAFRDHGRQWTAVAIAADWPGFGKATLAMLVRLQQRIRVEDRELYPLADDAHCDLPLRKAG
jgi:hypothetical protein